MSLIPFSPFDDMSSGRWFPWSVAPPVLFNQNFGSDLAEMNNFMRSAMNRTSSGLSEMNVDKNHFEVKLDCHHFKPEEMSVKVKDNMVTIHAKHEEKQDEHGYISREFTRSYLLPPGCDINKLKSQFTNSGMLSIECPRQVPEEKGVRSIPIERGNTKSITNN